VTWIIEGFDEATDEFLGKLDLSLLAQGAIERMLGEIPQEPTAEQVRILAPIFGLEPDRWRSAMRAPVTISLLGLGWLDIALLNLLSQVLGIAPEELGPYVYPLPRKKAQELFYRFTDDAPGPRGELQVSFSDQQSWSRDPNL
jgi:hypothetical protein